MLGKGSKSAALWKDCKCDPILKMKNDSKKESLGDSFCVSVDS